MRNLLTLVIPTKDRHPLTDRLLTSLNNQKCDCRIILADGSVEQTVIQAITDTEKDTGSQINLEKFYPHLKIDYIYPGPDNCTQAFIRKMSKAFDIVRTPFCMVVDNDDLVDMNGVQRGVSFLCDNMEYSTYQNDVRAIDIETKQIQHSLYKNNSLSQELAIERLYSCIENFNSFNYAIFRTQISQCFLKILDVFGVHNYQIFQKGWAYFAAIFGMCERRHDESYYYFIPGQSILQNSTMFHKFSSWHEYGDPAKETCQMISIISALYKYLYGVDIKEGFLEKFTNEVFKKCGLSDSEQYKDGLLSEIKNSPVYKLENKALYSILDLYNFDFVRHGCKQPKLAIPHKVFLEWQNI